MSAPPAPNYVDGTPALQGTQGSLGTQPGHVAGAPGTAPVSAVHGHGAGPAVAHSTTAASSTPGHAVGTSAAAGTVPHSAAPAQAAGTGAQPSLQSSAQPSTTAQSLHASGLPVLQGFEPAIGPQPMNNSLYSAQQITLVLTEKVWAIGDTFTVQTADGTHIMQVKGKVVSLHGKKKFSDMAGNEIFTLAEKKFKLNKTFHAEAPTGHNFDIEGNFSIGSSKSTVKFVNASNQQPLELRVKGDWLDRSAMITLGEKGSERIVAQMSRSFANAREIFGNKQTYFITVAPNVDLSLIAAICVGIDERENDK